MIIYIIKQRVVANLICSSSCHTQSYIWAFDDALTLSAGEIYKTACTSKLAASDIVRFSLAYFTVSTIIILCCVFCQSPPFKPKVTRSHFSLHLTDLYSLNCNSNVSSSSGSGFHKDKTSVYLSKYIKEKKFESTKYKRLVKRIHVLVLCPGCLFALIISFAAADII